MTNFLLATAVGLISAIIASLGLGGGSILIIYLVSFAGIEQIPAMGINLVFFIPVALVSLYFHLKNGFVDRSIALWTTLTGIPAAILGIYLANLLGNYWLTKMFAVLILLFGMKETFHKREDEQDKK